MICLLCKHDIISVPSYAAGIYHRTKVRYHIEDISPVRTGTDIMEKPSFVKLTKEGFSCERRAKRCVNIGKNEEKVRKLLNTAFNSFQDFFFRLFAIRIKCNGDTSSVFQFECIEKTIIRNDLITFVKFTFNRTNITYSDNSFFERLLSVFLCASWENNLICIYYQCSAFFGKKTSKKYDTQQST